MDIGTTYLWCVLLGGIFEKIKFFLVAPNPFTLSEPITPRTPLSVLEFCKI